MLKPIEDTFTNRCVKDSFVFVDKLRTLNLSESVMASFDVCSLFTNVPVTETIDIILDELKRNPQVCSIPLDILRELLLICTSNVQFLFNDTFIVKSVIRSCRLPLMFRETSVFYSF